MTCRRFIIAFLILLTAAGIKAQDFARIGERTISGSARYVGMSGAMTAIGGDPSAALDNPAGLGLYRRSEAMLTFGYAWDRTWQDPNKTPAQRANRFYVPQASLVFNVGPYNYTENGVLFNSIMLSYRCLHLFSRDMFAGEDEGASLGALLATTGVDLGIKYCMDANHNGNAFKLSESGSVNEFAIDWGMNISNKWYVGAGIHIQSHSMTANGKYQEQFYHWNDAGTIYSNVNETYLRYTGVGFNFNAGVIYRPISWLRFGFSIQTPTLGTMNIYSRGSLWAQTDSLRLTEAPNIVTPARDFHMPLRTSISAAFQCGYYGMLALQYDYRHQKGELDVHSLRAGLEVVPIAGMYINAGYAYESTFTRKNFIVPVDPVLDRQDTYFQNMRHTQYVSGAIGFRGKQVIVQAAYQFRWQGLNLFAHEKAIAYNMHTDTHRLVLTIGWHQGW